MARVFCAWELGGGLGHIRALAALGRALHEAGHEPVFALGNLTHAAETLGEFRWYPAPLLRIRLDARRPPLTATDMLAQLGYTVPEQMAHVLRAWLTLFRLEAPGAVVIEHAPAAMLAARIAGLPRIAFGHGFTSPPREDPMPPLRPWAPLERPLLESIDAAALAGVNEALAMVGAAPLPRMSELFEPDLDLLRTFAPLDPYGPRAGEYVGPMDDSPDGVALEWLPHEGPRYLAYIRTDYPHWRDVLNALKNIPGQAIVAVRGLAARDAPVHSTARVRVFADVVDFERVIGGADVVIGHAGAGLTAHSLRAGKPQALLPTHLEQALTARRLAELGVAAYTEAPLLSFANWFAGIAGNESLREAAARHSAPFAGHSTRQAAARAAGLVIERMRG